MLVIALLLHPLQLTLVQLSEGYRGCPSWADPCALGVELHRRRQQRLQAAEKSGPHTRRSYRAASQLRM